jgi:hypothetical protein
MLRHAIQEKDSPRMHNETKPFYLWPLLVFMHDQMLKTTLLILRTAGPSVTVTTIQKWTRLPSTRKRNVVPVTDGPCQNIFIVLLDTLSKYYYCARLSCNFKLWEKSNSQVCGYVKARLSIASVRTTPLRMRESRAPVHKICIRYSQGEGGAGLPLFEC